MTEKVLVASLLKGHEPWLDRFFKQLRALEYPKNLIRYAFIEEVQIPMLHEWCSENGRNCWIKTEKAPVPDRFEKLAHLRNVIVEGALQKEACVLWIDSDVVEIPPNLIVDLMKHNVPVVAPTVYIEGTKQFYDTLAFRFLDGENFPMFNPQRSHHDSTVYKFASDDLLQRVELKRNLPSLQEVASVGTCYLASAGLYTKKKVRYHGGDSEQVTFCKDVRNAGYKIYVDFNVKVHHAHLKNYGKQWH